MPTYPTPSLSLDETPISRRTLVYFRRRLQHELHELVIREFDRQVDEHNLTKKKLAERLGRNPSQITRWMAAPGNLEFDTFSDLMVGMGIDPRAAVAPLRRPAPDAQVTVHDADIAQSVAAIVDRVAQGGSGLRWLPTAARDAVGPPPWACDVSPQTNIKIPRAELVH